MLESALIRGVALDVEEAKVTLDEVPDRPGIAAAIFKAVAAEGIHVDMIVQNISHDGRTTDITFTVPTADFERSMALIEALKASVVMEKVSGSSDVAKVSVIGIGMRSHAGVAARAFQALADRKINIRAITTSEIKFSVLIDAAYTELAVRTLHSLYGLDK